MLRTVKRDTGGVGEPVAVDVRTEAKGLSESRKNHEPRNSGGL
jgi:hypothetical protein